MHQPLTDESLILTASSTRILHPSLRRALGVLDAQLDDELARYRRYRAGLTITPSSISALRRSLNAAPGLRLPTPVASVAAVAPTRVDDDITVNQTPAPGAPPLPPRTPHSFQNNPSVAATSALVVTAAQADASDAVDRLISPEDLPQFGFATDNFATDPAAPNDYLESSEALLRSLAQEEATVAAERTVLEGLLTPFGVGSMLLMLLGSGMFGYLIMNPASLNAVKRLALKVATFRSTPDGAPTNVAAVDVDGSSTRDVGWMNNSPALDANEFLNLSLDNISALRTRPGGLTLMPQPNQTGGLVPLQQLNGKTPTKAAKPAGATKPGAAITSFTPLNIKPMTPPAPVIAQSGSPTPSSGGGIFSSAPVRINPPSRPARNYEPAYAAPAPRYEAPAPRYEAPAPRYEAPAPRYEAPAPRYEAPAPRYEAPPETVKVLPPAPSPMTSGRSETIEPPQAAPPQPQGDYRVVTPYTNDADLEAAQKSNPNASFRNMEDGAYVQHDSYGSKAEADAKAAELRNQGVSAEVK